MSSSRLRFCLGVAAVVLAALSAALLWPRGSLAGAPASGPAGAPMTAPTGAPSSYRDEFNQPTLAPGWSWLREDPTHWSLSEQPGFLRITTQLGAFGNTAAPARNALLWAAPTGDFTIETRVVFTPTADIQSAGLVVLDDEANRLALLRAHCDFGPPCAGNAIYFDQVTDGQFVGSNFATALPVVGDAYLRLTRLGATYTAFASADGRTWLKLGAHTADPTFVPHQVGLFAYDAAFGAPEMPADFDYFALSPLVHQVYLPLGVLGGPRTRPYRYVADSAVCTPNLAVSYYQGEVRDRAGELQNGVCVHVAFFGPRNTKCSGCDGVGNGQWGFAPYGGVSAPPNYPVEIFVVQCPDNLPPGGQSDNWGDLTPLSDKWLLTTGVPPLSCTGITFREN